MIFQGRKFLLSGTKVNPVGCEAKLLPHRESTVLRGLTIQIISDTL